LAVVVLPYHKSTMQFFELYRMNVPIFVPSVEFLMDLDQAYSLLPHRILYAGIPLPKSVDAALVSRALNMSTLASPTRPMQPSAFLSDEVEESDRHDAVAQWFKLADYYQLPFVQYFHSWTELAAFNFDEERSKLDEISHSMQLHNTRRTSEVLSEWDRIMQSVQATRNDSKSAESGDGDERRAHSYEKALKMNCGFEEQAYSFHLEHPDHARHSLGDDGCLSTLRLHDDPLVSLHKDWRKLRLYRPEKDKSHKDDDFCGASYPYVLGGMSDAHAFSASR
jgi:hypothetical protein